MPTQFSLFICDGCDTPAYQRHSRTSVEAAKSVRADVKSMRERVYNWLLVFGPATDEMMQDALDMNPSTQRPRRIELVAAHRVVGSGTTMKTRSGRHAVAWRAVKAVK